MPPDPEIDISVQSDAWPDMRGTIERIARTTLSQAGYEGPAEISIVLADNERIQALNGAYRGKDKPTNVLSFPQDGPGMLGDVILAYETIEREAAEQDKSFEDHTAHMLVHGILHLLGHDHEQDDEAEKMEKIEIKILDTLGIKNPYESGEAV